MSNQYISSGLFNTAGCSVSFRELFQAVEAFGPTDDEIDKLVNLKVGQVTGWIIDNQIFVARLS